MMNVRLAAIVSLIAGVAIAAFAGVGLWPNSAHATMYTVNIVLDEAQAVSTCPVNPAPPNSSGTGTVTYDTSSHMLSWNITYQNLSGPVLAAHFHGPATGGETAAVQVTIPNSSPSTGSAVLSPAQETDFLNGLWYANFHTAACGGGEIRGQVAGGGVGGVTQLTDTAMAPLQTNGRSDNNTRLYASIAAGLTALALVGAGSALLAARRLSR